MFNIILVVTHFHAALPPFPRKEARENGEMEKRRGRSISWLYRRRAAPKAGFTLFELMIAIAIIGILLSIAVPVYMQYLDRAKVVVCITDIKAMVNELELFKQEQGRLPTTLLEIGWVRNDPWGNPYQYLNFSTVKGKGKMRKDRFMVPINSDYDLCSMGKDGQSTPPLTAKMSQDDIIVANDGSYIGLAASF